MMKRKPHKSKTVAPGRGVHAIDAVPGRIYLSLPHDGRKGSKVRVLVTLQCSTCRAQEYGTSAQQRHCKTEGCKGKLQQATSEFIPILHCFSNNVLLVNKDYRLEETADQEVRPEEIYGYVSPEERPWYRQYNKGASRLHKEGGESNMRTVGEPNAPAAPHKTLRVPKTSKRVAVTKTAKRGKKNGGRRSFADGDLGQLLKAGKLSVTEIAKKLKSTRASIHSQIYGAKNRGYKIIKVDRGVYKLVG